MLFLYVGRLDREKWIETLILCIEKLIWEKKQFHIHIYGHWTYTSQIRTLSDKHAKYITYHWRKNKKEILWKRKQADYFIMPSTFLETFWLTACESLLCWVPVIWNKKWWLIPFIDDTLDIQQNTGKDDWEKLYTLISKLIDNKITKIWYHKLITQTQSHYTIERRITSINHIISNQHNNTLMVSDFINYNWGGIETHIHDASLVLQKHKYNINLYGHQAPTGKRANFKKLIVMITSLCNIWDAYIIQQKIKKDTIWLIWRHSISRVIGRLPLRGTDETTQHIITHHELGLFHPFPSQTTHESQIPNARSLWAFIKAGQTNNLFKKIAIAGKYCMIRCVHKQLQKKVKTHIVPSERMIPIIRQRHPQADIVCIPHFVTV